MVKRKKHDKDKYYNFAKQQGYRARSAFKLIQLNKKYDFLSKAKVCIDLGAAPGGWLQVAAKYMPASSIILGIDLLPIRPIRNVKTFQCDMTSQKCRQIIKQELQTWSADVVLCDGAPNVGAEYSKDAFVQNSLALTALKLAVDVIGPGGTFVSKVFRSQDYNALLWVFKQLFKKVGATKPLSSRNESAEIFVVCEDYIAPTSIDPKLLDPKHVFSQVDMDEKEVTIFHPKFGVRKRHRSGYDEALGVTLTNSVTVSEFVQCQDPIRMLTDATAILFQSEEDEVFKTHKATSDEVLHCIQDLKVLGKSDFKRILKWRSALLEYHNAQQEPVVAEQPAKVEKTEEEVQLEKEHALKDEIANARLELNKKKKRALKKERERKTKLRLRAAMGMDLQGVEMALDDQVFSMDTLGLSKESVDTLMNAGVEHSEEDNDSFDDSEDSSDEEGYEQVVDEQMDSMYDLYMSKKKPSDKTKSAVKRTKIAKRALAGEQLVADSALYDNNSKAYAQMLEPDQSSDEDSDDGQTGAKLIVKPKLIEKPSVVASRWFSGNPLFDQIDALPMVTRDASDDEDIDQKLDHDGVAVMPRTDKEIRKEKRKLAVERKERREVKRSKADGTFEPEIEEIKANHVDDDVKLDDVEKDLSQKSKDLIRAGFGKVNTSKDDDSKFEIVKQTGDDRVYNSDTENYDIEERARQLALGTMMLRKSDAKDIVDSSFNRYAWNDTEGLPDWFMDDEEKNYRPQVPISKALIEQMRNKFMAMASKPMKKVAEARMRKKKQHDKKLKLAKKKATDIANLPDMSTREKLKSIEKTLKGAEMKKSNKVYVVSTRGGKKDAQNNKGKGKIKMVDARMKSDKRGMERAQKKRRKRK